MDYIKKTICLEDARTRTQGLMPYFEFGKVYESSPVSSCSTIDELLLETASGYNGNWGHFVANPCFLSDKGKTYETMLSRYYKLHNKVREGIKLRKVVTKGGEIIFTEDTGAFYLSGSCFAGGNEPDSVYEYAAYDASGFYATEINGSRKGASRVYKTYDDSFVKGEDYFIVLIKEYDDFIDLTKYLSGTTYSEALDIADIYSEPEEDEHILWSGYCNVVDYCIGRLNIPAYIYNKHLKAPKTMSLADVEEYIAWLSDTKNISGNCCNLKLWEEMGGQEMLDYLIASGSGYDDVINKLNDLSYSVPYIEFPVLLTQNFTDVGVMTNIDGVEYDSDSTGPVSSDGAKTRPHGFMTPDSEYESGLTENDVELIRKYGAGFTIDEIVMGSSGISIQTTEEYEAGPGNVRPIEVESLLKTLRCKKKYTDDEDNVLPGLFEYFSESPSGKMFKCVKNGEEWEMEELSNDVTDFMNGDGKPSSELYYTAWTSTSDMFYRTITLKESGPIRWT